RISLPAQMSINPTSGPIGTAVRVTTGPGWVPNSTIHVTFSGDVVVDATTDSTGAASPTFTVPAHNLGDVNVVVKDDDLGFQPSTTFTVTAGGHPPTIKSAAISGKPFVNTTFTGVATGV